MNQQHVADLGISEIGVRTLAGLVDLNVLDLCKRRGLSATVLQNATVSTASWSAGLAAQVTTNSDRQLIQVDVVINASDLRASSVNA